MPSFALASCQIIPHDIVVVTGDINIVAAWLIGKRR